MQFPPYRRTMLADTGFGFDELECNECRQLLEHARHGHIAISVEAMPMIVPVFYAVLDDQVVYRSTLGPAFAAATSNVVVAFQVDHLDETSGEGWTVVVQGIAIELPDVFLERAQSLPLTALTAGGAYDHFVSLPTSRISGHRIRRLPQR